LYKKITILLICLTLILLCIANVNADQLNNTDFDDLSNEISSTEINQKLNLHKDYQLPNTTQKHILINKSITIDGNNHTINAPNVSRVFMITADNVCIKNINFINSNSHSFAGGVISWWGNNGTLKNCNFTNNTAISAGGAVLWKGNDGTISNCNFQNNTVNYGSARTLTDGNGYNKSDLTIQIVNAEGGALFVSGNNMNINYCNFINNLAALNGGAIATAENSNIKISNTKFKNNTCQYNGGAIDLNTNNATLINITCTNNNPKELFINAQNTTIINSTFDHPSSIKTSYNVTMEKITYNSIGSFEELSNLINNTPEGGILILTKDYEFLNETNSKGIKITKTITIDGNGHTINGNKISRIFNITADNVYIKNINFINGNAWARYFSMNVGGGAIYWIGANGKVENCNFTNNSCYGLEEDPFENEEEYVDENGTIIHIIHIRPMGAKTDEGGAIVWKGVNGTVSKCQFTYNALGYPNHGGAICWRGNNGLIIDSVFLNNSAWCGSAIAWVGDNGTILSSLIASGSIFDGGIYWFGKNGLIKDSMLLAGDKRNAVRGEEVTADYNFWGDSIDNPNLYGKPENVRYWIVIDHDHKDEIFQIGQNITINYNYTTLIDKKGAVSQYNAFINKSGQINTTFNKTGYLKIVCINGVVTVKIDSRPVIDSKDITVYYDGATSFTVVVSDMFGKVANKEIKFTIDFESYYVKTDDNGVAVLKLDLKPEKYNIYTYYDDIEVKNKIIIKTPLITKNLSKKVKKTGKFKIKVLNSKGQSYSKQLVKVNFKGKTYKLKTNKKGIAIFKISKKLKKGKYTIKTMYHGLTQSNKIIVKK